MSRMLPDTLSPDVKSNAERHFFDRIKYEPNTTDWICLHSLGLGRHVTQRAGEIDFVLLVPNAGVFVLEVKGGRVRYDGELWRYIDRFNVTTATKKSPFEQARKNMFSLEERLQSLSASSPRLAKLRVWYGVVVPDDLSFVENVKSHALGERPDLIFSPADKSQPLLNYVNRLVAAAKEKAKASGSAIPTREDAWQLAAKLRGAFDQVPTLGSVIGDANDRLLEMLPEQYEVLDSSEPRQVITGSAGTGKSLVACEAARREARDGRRVMFLCYNRNLAPILEKNTKESDNITVYSLHQLMRRLIGQSCLHAEFEELASQLTGDQLFWEAFPEYASLALNDAPFQPADLLILDEAQDFICRSTLSFLDGLVRGGIAAGRWRIFADTQEQAGVYARYDKSVFSEIAAHGVRSKLVKNCRNTRPIATQACLFSDSATPMSGIDGPPVDYSWLGTSDNRLERAASVWRKLVKEMNPGGITFLTAKDSIDEDRTGLMQLGITTDVVSQQNAASLVAGKMAISTIATVSSFKGLENDAIILSNIDSIETPWWKSVSYVGVTRARVVLKIILPESQREVQAKGLERLLGGI